MAVETATATAGYRIEVTGSGWGHLHHDACDKWTSFVDPTDDRIRWYVATHRCGEPGTDWHESKLSHDGHRSGVTGRDGGMAAVGEPPCRHPSLGSVRDATVWPAMQELAHTLADLFPDAFIGATRHTSCR